MFTIVVLTLYIFIFTLSLSIVIDTNYGKIKGFQQGNTYRFINIPFAQPPINDLRFMPPQPIDAWGNDTWDGVSYAKANFNAKAPGCPQVPGVLGPYFGSISENCLFLNVYTPINMTKDTKYAVMLWIYGGSFISGFNSGVLFDPTAIMQHIQDVIVVAINYRLGIFGGLYDNTYSTGVQGNQGFLDQKMGIQWVYENIGYFGGDPQRITLYGESAGGHSVALQLLFGNQSHINAGILESAPLGLPLRDPVTWYDIPLQLTNLIGCENETETPSTLLNCWQTTNWIKILTAQYNTTAFMQNWASMPYTPTVGTDIIPIQPILAFENNTFTENLPPFIIGVNGGESYAFVNASEIYTYQTVYYAVAALFGAQNAETILDFYGVTEGETSNEYVTDYAKIGTDSAFRCPSRKAIRSAIKHDIDGWYYHFDLVNTALYKAGFPHNPFCFNTSCHGAEVLYIWLPQNFSVLLAGGYSEDTVNIAHQLQTYWTNFGKTLDPNEGKQVWDEYEADTEMLLRIIDDSFDHSIYVNETICDFWDDIGYAGSYCTDCAISPSSPSDDSVGLSVGAWIGIVMGGAIVGVIVGVFVCKYKSGAKDDEQEEVLMSGYVPPT